jgi:hypothetical protein
LQDMREGLQGEQHAAASAEQQDLSSAFL